MTSILDILPNDNGADSLSKIETNFSNLNSGKLENSHATDTATHGVTEIVGTTETQTLSNKTLDNPILRNFSGWEDANETWTYSSADGSTGIFNVAADVTSKYSQGMRVKYQQSQALTAYWNLDANSNSQVGSFNGTDTNITYSSGKFGNAATFNGTTSKIVITDNASLKPTGEFTIGCWFKTSATGTNKTIFQSWSNTVSAGIRLWINTNNVLEFVSGKNTGLVTGTDRTFITGTTTVTDNSFHYVVVSFRNNYCQIYLDGKLESSGYCFSPVYAATNYVRIGCGNDTGTDIFFMNGQIDDLLLINGYALDEKTIKAKYDSQTAQGTGNITVQKYALITAVGAYSGGNTPITIWGGTDYSLQNATISSPYYATVHCPFDFPKKILSPLLGYQELTSTFTSTVVTTPTDVAGLSIRVNVPATASRIKITTDAFYLRSSAAAGSGCSNYITEDGVQIMQKSGVVVAPNYPINPCTIVYRRPTPGYHTYAVQISQGSAGTMSYSATANSPAFISVEME